MGLHTRVTRLLEKTTTFAQVFGKSSQNSGQAKKMPKYIHQITFETLKQLLYSGYPLKLLTLLKI